MEFIDNSDDKENKETYFDSDAPITKPDNEKKSSGTEFSEDLNRDPANGLPQINPENKKFIKKLEQIQSVLSKKPVSVSKLKKLAISEGGLVTDELRKIVWPKLLELTKIEETNFPEEEELKNHPEYQQVLLDVNRSLRRFPPGIPLNQRLALQSQLTVLILRVIMAHPRLRYYQGYHDVAVTLLLVTGLDCAYAILEKLSINHLKDCMEPTMEKTSHLLNYIFPLVKHQNKELYEYLEKSDVGTMFALPWFLTWFSHSLNQYTDVVRLFDYFLASEPLMPLYLSAVIIAFRCKEILNTPCDMANLHSLLSQIPDNLPFETLLVQTTELYKKHPPKKIQVEALAKTRQEEEQKKREYRLRRYRMNQNLPFIWRLVGRVDPERRLPIWAFVNPNRAQRPYSGYTYLVATATFAVGLYAVYLKAVEGAEIGNDR